MKHYIDVLIQHLLFFFSFFFLGGGIYFTVLREKYDSKFDGVLLIKVMERVV